MYRFLIADDHAITRRGIKELLLETYTNADVVDVMDAGTLLNYAIKENWSLIVSDISMPGQSGLEMLSELKKLLPKTPVLILSMHSEEEYAIRVIKAGGHGYLTKDGAVEEEFLKAVATILGGRKYITPSVAERLAMEVSHDIEKLPHELLSDREFHVFKLLAQGNSTGEVSAQLSLSVNTIGTYRRRILEKMNIKNNAAIVTYAINHNLLS